MISGSSLSDEESLIFSGMTGVSWIPDKFSSNVFGAAISIEPIMSSLFVHRFFCVVSFNAAFDGWVTLQSLEKRNKNFYYKLKQL